MVGIDISDRSIKIVEITDGNNSQLRTVCWSALAAGLMRRGIVQDVEAVARAVAAALEQCLPVPVAGRDVVASIPETQSFVRVLDLPAMTERETSEAVPWAVRQHLPFDPERVYLDWQPLVSTAGEATRQQVMAGAAQRSVVDPLLAVLDALGMNVVALELEAQAVIRCLLPRDPVVARDILGVLVVDLGGTSTNVVFFDQGAMRFTASVQLGGEDLTARLARQLHMQPEMAATLKAAVGTVGVAQDAGAAATLRAVTLELVRGVERVVREMTAAASPEQRVRAILLSGGSANLPGIVDVFAEVFAGAPVQLGNPWTNIPRNDDRRGVQLSAGDALYFTTAIGLALRRPEVLA